MTDDEEIVIRARRLAQHDMVELRLARERATHLRSLRDIARQHANPRIQRHIDYLTEVERYHAHYISAKHRSIFFEREIAKSLCTVMAGGPVS